jgi:hypothetical protein
MWRDHEHAHKVEGRTENERIIAGPVTRCNVSIRRYDPLYIGPASCTLLSGRTVVLKDLAFSQKKSVFIITRLFALFLCSREVSTILGLLKNEQVSERLQ